MIATKAKIDISEWNMLLNSMRKDGPGREFKSQTVGLTGGGSVLLPLFVPERDERVISVRLLLLAFLLRDCS